MTLTDVSYSEFSCVLPDRVEEYRQTEVRTHDLFVLIPVNGRDVTFDVMFPRRKWVVNRVSHTGLLVSEPVEEKGGGTEESKTLLIPRKGFPNTPTGLVVIQM